MHTCIKNVYQPDSMGRIKLIPEPVWTITSEKYFVSLQFSIKQIENPHYDIMFS